ncbi:HVO_0758 family zinc finger protein [Halorussus pelagicus]|uniref:HVO_0758 family zinc finger protein n=1 Tax=Halorussus pelagicus TaxID=2505977 RepID=UPI000FFB2695|nr:HVO_0758 family zinc finger protein [Halorussus pelagicus]
MKSIRRGLWDGEVAKDPRGRFSCRICRERLAAHSETEDGGVVRWCPDCDRAWKTRATPRWRTTGG